MENYQVYFGIQPPQSVVHLFGDCCKI
uniref:Uncharacterized protein n=1 Tax=Arundo donax TaxID=35708 RepID=A0A0A9A7T9_ARUDO